MMTDYDVILFHPPAIYDFRHTPMFPGAFGRNVEGLQFTKVPIGMLSIADYLDRNGYRVILDNIGDRMICDPEFDAEKHIRESSAQVYAIGLHFQQHSQGGIEIARLCKKYHPGAFVIVGGLTATCFHKEIIEKYDFIDGVIRAEAERPMLKLMQAYEKSGRLTDTPNLTYRSNEGEIIVNPMMAASTDLDDFEYTRFDLIEPKTSIFPEEADARYSLEVCRGCTYNCTICGGSAYTYKKYLGMKRPAFRSPSKIVHDIKTLNEYGISFIGLFQDARMAGKGYWQELFHLMIKEKPYIERLSLDILGPVDETFVKEARKVTGNLILHLCPDTGSDEVRRLLGRNYTNEDLLETIKLCHSYHIPVTNFFSVGLAGETEKHMKETWELWKQLDEMDHEAMKNGYFGGLGSSVPIGGQILGPIVLDPGSRAFDNPKKYGYRLLYKNLEEYISWLSKPSWHQWLNYETLAAGKDEIVEMIHRSIEFTVDQRERYGIFTNGEAYYEKCMVEADRAIVKKIDEIMEIKDPDERMRSVITLRLTMDEMEKRRMFFPE
ncbi:MAG: radical SAM protein [Deltaproteobacteria bacterium]|nr:radical SAM protein [Deltaproteobacteria bacterium]